MVLLARTSAEEHAAGRQNPVHQKRRPRQRRWKAAGDAHQWRLEQSPATRNQLKRAPSIFTGFEEKEYHNQHNLGLNQNNTSFIVVGRIKVVNSERQGRAFLCVGTRPCLSM